jgi:ubiquinone/menaquinone biosynthesis C-methylase UbiE
MDLNKIREQFNSIAEKYDRHRRCFIPCFDDFYVRSVSLLKYFDNGFANIVDLGAGTGLLTKAIYEIYPESNYTLIDVSTDMLDVAKKRFHGLNNFTFMEYNYAEDIPVENCDLICSALSIHHLDNGDKGKLYKNIHSKLNANGCFINHDQFTAKSEILNDMYDKWWQDYIINSGITYGEDTSWQERRKLDRENTVDETMELLRSAGFGNVECAYNFMKFGVIIAVK